MPKRNIILLAIVAAVAVAAILMVNYVESRRRAQEQELEAIRSIRSHLEGEVLAWRTLDARVPDLKKLGRLIEKGRQEHQLTPEERKKVTEGAVKGMVQALRDVTGDPYLRYVPLEDQEAFDQRIKGTDRGLGLQVEVKGGLVDVLDVMGGSPAHLAGMVSGDRIVRINGKDIAEMDLIEVRKQLRTPPREKLELTVQRPRCVVADGGVEQIRVMPGEFPVQTVEGLWRDEKGQWVYQVDPAEGIHYVRITEFLDSTKEQFQAAMRKMTAPRGLVLDLRDNPGGLPGSAAELANLFLSKGRIFTIVTIEGDKANAKPFLAYPGDGMYGDDLHIAVLVDAKTSSAAELVAGAMRLHRRAVLVGAATRGKTRVQDIIPVPGLGLIVMSTGRSYVGRPDNADSLGAGFKFLEPDALVEIDPRALVELTRLRARARALPGKPRFKPLAGTDRTLRDELRRLDAQLAKAVALLREPADLEKILKTKCLWAETEHE